ncbi:Protein of unknown function [Pyronema omphalodes CBS 100304]|uniref:Uncharacterized protein n=1 Tax=Pyronema omphalodes (strain CBS 100304) TaxID=1076935 RepID=U4L8F7_PYROM|nr:Protein of unknown function [Pyronema omphalodes CBS 100304]
MSPPTRNIPPNPPITPIPRPQILPTAPLKSITNKFLNEEFTIDSQIFGVERIGEVYPPISDSVLVPFPGSFPPDTFQTGCPLDISHPIRYRTVTEKRDNPRQRRREVYKNIPVRAINLEAERGRSRIGRGRGAGNGGQED